ncbi:AMP-binding protein [Ornithinimicrobium sp. F0845]|uniref:phenylacetate--CoA ligase family protein n=1 Tax=Ornithinimicrobium sp. F0845 TaxID=2926412 RepID=UPI001FF51783|nr:AMP-binding protein [Ornithinimicrobium sp. F0845]MCK0114176.1 AMP-binding protein [Ornithinimicrobium sp. F0845]
MSIDAALQDHLQARGLDRAVADLMGRAEAVPGLARRFAAAGVDPAAVTSVAALSELPVLPKDAVIDLQREEPPFGGLLADGAEVVRVFQSPGPLYEPQLAGADSWRWGQVFSDLDIGPGDTVLNAFGYHLSPAGAMMEAGALAVGARVLPGGIGNQDLQVQAIADLGVTAYSGLPSYLKALVERYDEAGLPRERWRLDRAMVTAEPLPDSLRAVLTERVGTVRMAYGTGETGLLAYENGDGAGLVLADGVLVQVCDIATGAPITDETEGEVVVTVLRPDYPLVRFGTGDLSGWMLGPDGSLRLRGVLGRTGAAVKVKGMFLHPAQIAPVMAGVPGVADYRFVVGRVDHVDTLRCEVVPAPGVDAAELVASLGPRVREGLRFRAEVVAVEQLSPGDGPILDTRDWD